MRLVPGTTITAAELVRIVRRVGKWGPRVGYGKRKAHVFSLMPWGVWYLSDRTFQITNMEIPGDGIVWGRSPRHPTPRPDNRGKWLRAFVREFDPKLLKRREFRAPPRIAR
jgi:hypothetical protein